MSLRPHAIEIDGGILKSASISRKGAPRPSYTGIGDYYFTVDLIEEDGGRVVLWDGSDYAEAVIKAERARAEFAISGPVRDKVGGGE